jgi:hypothetical protein
MWDAEGLPRNELFPTHPVFGDEIEVQ